MEKSTLPKTIKKIDINIRTVFCSFFSEYELTRPQLSILAFLFKNDDKDITQKEIEKELGLQKSTVSGLIDRLEAKDFIKRVKNKNDSRINNIVLTQKSIDLNDKAVQLRKQFDEKIIEGISDNEFEELMKILKKVEKNLEEMKEVKND